VTLHWVKFKTNCAVLCTQFCASQGTWCLSANFPLNSHRTSWSAAVILLSVIFTGSPFLQVPPRKVAKGREVRWHRGQTNGRKRVRVTRRKLKVKVIPQQAEVAQGVPGRLRPRIFLTFSTSRSSAIRTGRLYPRRNPWYSLSSLSRPQGTWFRRG